jgi:hypothetical protein
MEKSSVIRMWVTNKNTRKITLQMRDSMVAFLSTAAEHGCLGSTFAEDDERIIACTTWSEEEALERFRSSEAYKILEGTIIQSFVAAGFEIPADILFNSTARVLFNQ